MGMHERDPRNIGYTKGEVMGFIDITGMKFGKLTVLEKVKSTGQGARWLCICDCGNKTVTQGGALRNGSSTCCGCLGDEKFTKFLTKHGMSRERPYRIYQNMQNRCNNYRSKDFKNYGGRGIKVCKKWSTFEGFWEDMKKGYLDHLTLERIDNDKGYCKENCTWATKQEQSNNRCTNVWLKCFGEKLTLTQVSVKYGICKETLRHRIASGMGTEEAVTRKLLNVGRHRQS
jgi:hypothetical protein